MKKIKVIWKPAVSLWTSFQITSTLILILSLLPSSLRNRDGQEQIPDSAVWSPITSVTKLSKQPNSITYNVHNPLVSRVEFNAFSWAQAKYGKRSEHFICLEWYFLGRQPGKKSFGVALAQPELLGEPRLAVTSPAFPLGGPLNGRAEEAAPTGTCPDSRLHEGEEVFIAYRKLASPDGTCGGLLIVRRHWDSSSPFNKAPWTWTKLRSQCLMWWIHAAKALNGQMGVGLLQGP